MIVHIVLFEPRQELSEAQRREIFDDLTSAARSIATLRRCRIGQRLRHGLPGYESAMRVDYQYAAIMEFENRDGLEAYLRHPAHETAGRHFTMSARSALAYDYEVEDAATFEG